MNKDYCYRILELNKNATKSDLEKSYRNLALKYHPDKNHSTDAVEKFKKIKDSYDFLKNISKEQENRIVNFEKTIIKLEKRS